MTTWFAAAVFFTLMTLGVVVWFRWVAPASDGWLGLLWDVQMVAGYGLVVAFVVAEALGAFGGEVQ